MSNDKAEASAYDPQPNPPVVPVLAPEAVRGPLSLSQDSAPGTVVLADPTQVRRPWRATARTLFAALVALAAMFPLLVNATGLDETAGPVTGAIAIMGAITRVMALPQVEVFLRTFVPFLSAAPKEN